MRIFMTKEKRKEKKKKKKKKKKEKENTLLISASLVTSNYHVVKICTINPYDLIQYA